MKINSEARKVLALFNSMFDLLKFRTILWNLASMHDERDFFGSCSKENLGFLILDNQPQLLFIDATMEFDAAAIVEEWRIKNPQLVAVSYASFETTCPCFDRIVDRTKEDANELILQFIQSFHSGSFRHT